jgi:glutamate dehydrogenase (NADP+)
MDIEKLMFELEKKHPGESEYLQAVREVLESIEDVVNENPQFETEGIIDRIIEQLLRCPGLMIPEKFM